MAIVHRHFDFGAPPFSRQIIFNSTAGDFTAGDIIDIKESSHAGARKVVVEVASGGSCTFAVNAVWKRYGLMDDELRLNGSAPDLDTEATVVDPNPVTIDMGAGESLELDLPVNNLTFMALTGGVLVKVWG